MANLANMTPEAIEAWNRLNESWGQPINVISTYRDPATNARVGGAKRSQHMHGNAFDISTAGMTPEQIDALIKAGAKAGFRGFGGYNGSLHFDVGPARTWGPDYGSGSTPAYLKNALAGVEFSQAVPTIMTKGGQAVEPDQIKKDAMAQSTGVLGMAGAQPSGMMGQRTPIKERFRDPDFWNELALTFHSMSSFPNEAAIRSLEGRVSTSRERKREQDQINKTIAFFEKANMPQLAELARVSPTAAINAYGQTMKPGYKVMTGAQVNQMYAGANLPADKLFNVSPTGQITQVGGGGVTVDMSGGGYKDKYWEEDVKSLAKRIDAMKQGGAVAAENLQTLQVMRDLYEQSPSGAIMGRFAEIFPEATDASAIVNSLRVSLAPKLRVEGSGSTSDIEYEGMLQSLGSFRNSPQANKAIIDLMMAKMELNAKRAEIANQVRPGGLDPYEAAAKIQQLETQLWSNNPLIQQVKELAGAAPKRIQQPAAGSPAAPGQPTHRFNPQTRQVEAIE